MSGEIVELHVRLYRRASVLLLVLLLVAFALGFLAGRASGEDDRPYLRVSVPGEAWTYDCPIVHVESRVWGANETGNATLVPSRSWVNVSLLDETHDTVVASFVTPLWNGTADVPVCVEPAWTSATVNVSVADYEHALIGYATMRTHMSDEYLVWVVKTDAIEALRDLSARMSADADGREGRAWAFSLSLAATIVTLVLVLVVRLEHRKARRHHVKSFWDRCADYWIYSFVQDETYVWLDPRRTWDRASADKWELHRRRAKIRALKDEIVETEEVIDRVERGLDV